MATKPVTLEQIAEAKAAFEKFGSKAAAARSLGLHSATFTNRLNASGERPAPPTPSVEDMLGVHKLKKNLSSLQKRTREAEEFAMAEKTLREACFSLAADPVQPPSWNTKKSSSHKGETLLLMLSDTHVGEVVSKANMGGKNSYNTEIAGNRIRRYFENVINLSTTHWSGVPPECIYLLLMGDLITGEIHEELAKTNDLQSIGSVRACSGFIIAGLEMLKKAFPKTPINVVTLPGNHSRTSKKPESKDFAIESYDTLIGWIVEAHAKAKGWQNIEFSAPLSGDALIDIYGWKFLVTHGDRIGSRGGAGMIGPAATATRGFIKVIQEYARGGDHIDWVLIGHFHTELQLESGFVNGSVIGPNEYGKSGRFIPHGAAQWMLSVHPRRGVARRWLVQLGDPSEGSMYKSRND